MCVGHGGKAVFNLRCLDCAMMCNSLNPKATITELIALADKISKQESTKPGNTAQMNVVPDLLQNRKV